MDEPGLSLFSVQRYLDNINTEYKGVSGRALVQRSQHTHTKISLMKAPSGRAVVQRSPRQEGWGIMVHFIQPKPTHAAFRPPST